MTTQPITSVVVDYYIGVGAAVHQLQMALLEAPEVEVRVKNGLLTVWKDGVELRRIGTESVPLTYFDWQDIASRVAVS